MFDTPVRILSDKNNVRFVELSATYDHLFSSPPAVEHLIAAFDEKSATIYRFNSETGQVSLTLSADEMSALLESYHAHRMALLSVPPFNDETCWIHTPGGWNCEECRCAAGDDSSGGICVPVDELCSAGSVSFSPDRGDF